MKAYCTGIKIPDKCLSGRPMAFIFQRDKSPKYRTIRLNRSTQNAVDSHAIPRGRWSNIADLNYQQRLFRRTDKFMSKLVQLVLHLTLETPAETSEQY